MLQDNHPQISILEPGAYEAQMRAIQRLPRRDRAAITLYRSDNGEFGFPQEMLNAALQDAVDELRGNGVRAEMPSMPYREFIPFNPGTLHPDTDHPTEPKKHIRHGWLPDVRQTRNGIVTRARFPSWGFTAQCWIAKTCDDPIISAKTVFEHAGLKRGIGAYRPPHGPFGTFAVVEIGAAPTP
jgi:hypothetical protein